MALPDLTLYKYKILDLVVLWLQRCAGSKYMCFDSKYVCAIASIFPYKICIL